MLIVVYEDVLWFEVAMHNFEIKALLKALNETRGIKDCNVGFELAFLRYQIA